MTTATIPPKNNSHRNYAARRPAGTEHPVTLKKDGVYHTQRMPDGSTRTIIACGNACSESFSGPNLYRILKPGFELEQRFMRDLCDGRPAETMSIHTSSGVTEALTPFLEALEVHLPWKEDSKDLDWCVSLQMEGASAVWAAVDMVLQQSIFEDKSRQQRIKVAVGATSYHGPPSTSFGAKSPLWYKNHQLIYPVPTAHGYYDENELLQKYEKFLDDHGHEVGAMLIEPQWGSSQAALPWPEHLLKTYVSMAKERGIKVVCDEIMCGLGRHGKGTLFVSEYLDLDPDAVTFGKAIATGLFPLSGAILKTGRDVLNREKCSVMQSHTYAGSSARALMAATEVLKEFVIWLPSVAHLGDEMGHIMAHLAKMSEGLLVCHGQGLMWGGIFSHSGLNHDLTFRGRVVQAFKHHCEDAKVIPYFIPVGGFMISPVIDIDVATIYEIGQRLEEAISRTKAEVGWVPVEEEEPAGLRRAPAAGIPQAIASASTLNLADLAEMAQHSGPRAPIATLSSANLAELGKMANQRGSLHLQEDLGNDKCVPYLHATKCCTSCGSFVPKDILTRFRSPSMGTVESVPEGETLETVDNDASGSDDGILF